MNDTHIREMINTIINTTGVTVQLERHHLYDTLTRYWQNYAVGTIGLDMLEELAYAEQVPMSLSEAREILYQIEENGDISYDFAAKHVQEWAENFDWENPEEPIPYEEFTWKTCNWQIIADLGSQQILIDAVPYTFSLGRVIRRAAEFAAARTGLAVKCWLVVVAETQQRVFDSSKNWHAGFGTPRLGEDEAKHEVMITMPAKQQEDNE